MGKTEQLKLVEYRRLESTRRLAAQVRRVETKNPKCPVCSDDSLFVGVAKLPIAEITLKKFIDEILPQKFGVSTSNIMVMVG